MKKRLLSVLICYYLTIILNDFIRSFPVTKLSQKSERINGKELHFYGGFRSIFFCFYWLQLLFEDYDFYSFYRRAMHLTDLDSNANLLYRYAALRCMFFYHRSDAAQHILSKALSSSFNRNDWRIYVYLAYLYAHCENDNKKAKATFSQLAQNTLDSDNIYLKHNWPACPAYLLQYNSKN